MLLRSIILTGAIQGFFLVLLLKAKEKSSPADRLLILWLIIIACQLACYYDDLSATPFIPGSVQLIGFSLPLLSSPIIYFYISSLSFNIAFQRKTAGLHLLAFTLWNFCVLYFNIVQPTNIALIKEVPQFSSQVPALIKYMLTALLAIVPASYIILSLKVLLKYQKLLPQNYSNTDRITLAWLRWIVISLLVLFVILFPLIRFGVNYSILNYQNLFGVVGVVLTFYLFFIGYFGLRQTTVFSSVPVALQFVGDLKATYKNSGLTDAAVNKLFQKLIAHMQQSQPFLNENLNLATLATELNITPNQLSQVINQKSSVNFFNFINQYRVQAVKEKLKDPAYAHYSILGIGYECGFRSKASFNKIFKEVEGVTPSEYQKL
jgi:AraC-like DNA-binding protein